MGDPLSSASALIRRRSSSAQKTSFLAILQRSFVFVEISFFVFKNKYLQACFVSSEGPLRDVACQAAIFFLAQCGSSVTAQMLTKHDTKQFSFFEKKKVKIMGKKSKKMTGEKRHLRRKACSCQT